MDERKRANVGVLWAASQATSTTHLTRKRFKQDMSMSDISNSSRSATDISQNSLCRSPFSKPVFASYRGSMHSEDCFSNIENLAQGINGLDMCKGKDLNAILPSC